MLWKHFWRLAKVAVQYIFPQPCKETKDQIILILLKPSEQGFQWTDILLLIVF